MCFRSLPSSSAGFVDVVLARYDLSTLSLDLSFLSSSRFSLLSSFLFSSSSFLFTSRLILFGSSSSFLTKSLFFGGGFGKAFFVLG